MTVSETAERVTIGRPSGADWNPTGQVHTPRRHVLQNGGTGDEVIAVPPLPTVPS
jgi:hypothetical protein